VKETGFGDIKFDSSEEVEARKSMLDVFKNCPIPDDEIMNNLGLFLNSKNLSRILFMDFLYQKIIDTQGVILDFGTRWGQNASLFASLRGIYEPFNRQRKIVAFDTFEGFKGISPQDGSSTLMKVGADNVTPGYEKYLAKIIELQEADNPLSHITKYAVVKGDAIEGLELYLACHPETIISLAYFDFDLYEPTKECLDMIQPYLIKGSVLAFDELNDKDSPGETVALREAIGLNKINLKRYRYVSRASYFIL